MKAGSRAPERRAPASAARVRRLIRPAIALLVLALFAFPVVYLAWSVLDEGGEVLDVLQGRRTAGPLGRSLLIATLSALAAGLVGTLIAWSVARTDLPGRRVWRLLAPLPLVIPSFVGATAVRFAFGPGGLIPFVPRLDGFWGALVVLVVFTYPYVYLPVAARLSVSPPSLEEAARLLGSRAPKVFRTVTWPQIRGPVVAGSLLVFLYALSDFGAVSIMRYDTLTRAIFSSRLSDPTTSLTLGFLLALIALVVAAAERSMAGRQHIEVTSGAARPPRFALGRVRPLVGVGIGLVVTVGLIAPLAGFIAWWVRGSMVGGEGIVGMLQGLADLAGPAFNSAIAGIVAAVVAVATMLPIALFHRSRGSAIARAGGLLTSATFALPGLVVALAIVFWVVRAPESLFILYQTFPLLIAAYVINFGAQALRATADAVEALPEVLSEAAGTLGADPRRRFRSIQLPLLMPGITAGGGLVLLSVLKELPATLLLAPIGFDTLATRIWNSAEEGFLANAGVASLVLIGLSGMLTWLLVLRGQPAD